MTAPALLDDPAVDVAFAIDGRRLPRDHAQALADALAVRLPWLATHPTAGVHPVKVVPGEGSEGWLSQRARLLLRVPQSLQPALAVLDGCTLGVAGNTLRLGPPTPHRLLPHGTLYAYFVAAALDDEAAFMRDVQAELDALRVEAHVVCGKRQQRHSEAGIVVGFSLMLHGLGPAASLTVQRAGIGPHRALGCGLFVPHKSAAAVGD